MASRPEPPEHVHDKLESGSHQIRLIQVSAYDKHGKICCELKTYDIRDHVPDYIALSYRWGPEAPVRRILLNGQPFTVRENLWMFLDQCVKFGMKVGIGAEYLWIDAVCINQADEVERMHQVGRMAQIYREARMVLVWLGPAHSGSDQVMMEMGRFVPEESQEENKTLLRALSIQNLYALCMRAYWQRLWIFQELMLARSITLMCGSLMIKWRCFLIAIRESHAAFLAEDSDEQSVLRGVRESPSFSITAQLVSKRNMRSLFDLTRATSHLQCAEKRDKVYALLGVARHGHNDLLPDYSRPLIGIMNDVLRNHHQVKRPKSLAEVEEQCQQLSEIFGTSMTDVYCDEEQPDEQQLSPTASSATCSDFPLKLPECNLSLWWAVSYRHMPVKSLLLKSSSAQFPHFGGFFTAELLRAIDLEHQAAVDFLVSITELASYLPLIPPERVLHRAVKTQNRKIVQTLLSKEGQLINKKDDNGDTALSIACRLDSIEILNLLVNHALTDINTVNNEGDTPLFIAMKNHNAVAAKILLGQPFLRVETKNLGNKTLRDLALTSSDAEMLKHLVEHPQSAGVNAIGSRGRSLLHLVVDSGSLPLTKLLLLFPDCDVNKATIYGQDTALHIAIPQGDIAITKLLLSDKRLDLNRSNSQGWRPIHIAIQQEARHALALLLADRRLDVNCLDSPATNPLHLAIEMGFDSIVRTLLCEERLILNRTQGNGRTTLHVAVQSAIPLIVDLIIQQKGLHLDGIDSKGQSPLHLAVEIGCLSVVEILLRDKAGGINNIDKMGRTPLHHAVALPSLDIAHFLIQSKDVTLTIADHLGQTILHYAARNGSLSLMSKLLNIGHVDPSRVSFNDFNKMDYVSQTPLCIAAREGQTEMVACLLASPLVSLEEDGNASYKAIIAAAKCVSNSEIAFMIQEEHDRRKYGSGSKRDKILKRLSPILQRTRS